MQPLTEGRQLLSSLFIIALATASCAETAGDAEPDTEWTYETPDSGTAGSPGEEPDRVPGSNDDGPTPPDEEAPHADAGLVQDDAYANVDSSVPPENGPSERPDAGNSNAGSKYSSPPCRPPRRLGVAKPDIDFTNTPKRPTTGDRVEFEAEARTYDGMAISEYRWDFRSDGSIDARGKTVEHTFQKRGSRSVTLVVIYNECRLVWRTESVSVGN